MYSIIFLSVQQSSCKITWWFSWPFFAISYKFKKMGNWNICTALQKKIDQPPLSSFVLQARFELFPPEELCFGARKDKLGTAFFAPSTGMKRKCVEHGPNRNISQVPTEKKGPKYAPLWHWSTAGPLIRANPTCLFNPMANQAHGLHCLHPYQMP